MSRRALALAAIWIVPGAALLAMTWAVYVTYRIDVPEPLGDEARAAVMAALRPALVGAADDAAAGASAPVLPSDPALARALHDQGPVIVTVWYLGQRLAQAEGRGPTLAHAIHDARDALTGDERLARLNEAQRQEARIKVDVVVGRAPLAGAHPLWRSLGIHPGLEGLGMRVDDREILLAPDDLILEHVFGVSTPLSFVPDFTIGLDFEKAEKILAQRAGLAADEATGGGAWRYFRFRTDSFIERPRASRGSGPPLPLVRGLPPRPELTADSLREAALAGGRYLVAHLASNGRYVYERNLTTGRGTSPLGFGGGRYSIPRHAGTTYYLAELYRLTGESFLREPIERAFAHLGELIEAGGCTGTLPDGEAFACVVDRGRTRAELGSTALTVVALAEYHRATGDTRYDALARELTSWILFMQRPDGSFAHLYDVRTGERDETAQLLYYSGEAALALARMHLITGDERYRDATERALDHLVDWYDFFLGGFFYGEEHWTCIAAEAAYPAIRKDRYRAFCSGYAAFQRTQQAEPGDFPDQPDYVGSYNLTPFLVPQNTPAGSRTEAVISAYLLGAHHGKPEPAIRRQILAALHYTLGQQITRDSDFAVSAVARGRGAVPATPVDRMVRIDYVQHVGSAMIRAIEVIESAER